MWQVVFAQSTHVVTVPRGLVCVVIPAMCCSHIFQVSSKFVLGFWSRRESKFGHSHYFGYWQRACTAAQALISRMLPSCICCCTDWLLHRLICHCWCTANRSGGSVSCRNKSDAAGHCQTLSDVVWCPKRARCVCKYECRLQETVGSTHNPDDTQRSSRSW